MVASACSQIAMLPSFDTVQTCFCLGTQVRITPDSFFCDQPNSAHLLSLAKSLMPDVCARSKMGFFAFSRAFETRTTDSLLGAGAAAVLKRAKKDIANKCCLTQRVPIAF